MNNSSKSKSKILMYALDVYEDEGRAIFTAAEITSHTGMVSHTVRSNLRRLRFRGFLRSYENASIKCGGLECKLSHTIWALTRKGAEFAAERQLDFEPVTGQYLLKNDAKNGVPVAAFLMELD